MLSLGFALMLVISTLEFFAKEVEYQPQHHMRYFLSIIGIIGSFYMVKYRERVGDMFGEADWMKKVGGVYMIVVYVAVFICAWSLAELTNTTDILFAPLTYLIPGLRKPPPDMYL